MNQGRAHISSRYQEYPAVDTSTLLAEAIPRQLAVMDRALKLVARCDRRVDLIQHQVDRPGLVQHDGRMAKVWRASREIQRYGSSLLTLLQQYPRLDLKQSVAEPVVTALTNEAEALALGTDRLTAQPATTETAVARGNEKLHNKTISLIKNVAILKGLLGEHRASLMLEQRARQASIIKPKRSRALFDESSEQSSSVLVSSVLERFKEKGWKVDLRQRDSEVKPDELDAFDLSLSLLDKIKQPASGLLQKNQTSGVLRFPVVLRVNSRLSDHMIKLCTSPSVGYNLYVVFGGYVAIDNVIALGIRHDLVEVESKDNCPQLDFARFLRRLPNAMAQHPEMSAQLQELQPVQPTRLAHQHYYTLMLPHGTLGESRHAIGDWTFLTA
jgi:hypothetical protein